MEWFSRRLTIIALGVSLMTGTVAEANLVSNGGFETGDLSGWTVTPATSGSLVGVDDFVPRSGVYGAYFAAVERMDDSISQTIATVPGSSYIFEFWLSNDDTLEDNDFHAFWNGVSVLDLVNAAEFPDARYAFPVSASGTSTTIGFSGANTWGFYNLDDVQVLEVAGAEPVPEPSTLLLLGAGLAGAGLAGRRFRQSRWGKADGR